MNVIKLAVGVIYWCCYAVLRLALIIVGFIVVPFTDAEDNPIFGNKQDPFPRPWYMKGKPEKLRDYMWRAFRNPTNNMRYWQEEPDAYRKMWFGHPDPDTATRREFQKSAWRLIIAGIYFDLWYQRRCKDGEYFEARIGWKFGSTVPGFGHTLQIRKGD